MSVRKQGLKTASAKKRPAPPRNVKPKDSLVDFFLNSPLVGSDPNLERNRDFGRELPNFAEDSDTE